MSSIAARIASSSTSAETRVALYLRVSTGRQAESDLSIPDQRRQIERYCAARGWTIAGDYVEPGSTATDDRRPAFQAMIDAATEKPATFAAIVVHSYSRFFRDQFQFELHARKLARNGVQIVSITQELGDGPMGAMMRQMVTLFDEYQSKENAKHTLRAMCENARQGYWNGARPPIGYRIVAADQRGTKIKKTLEIDPLHVETVRLIFRLALEGADGDGSMGLKAITSLLNERNIRTRDGGRWGVAAVHQVLTRTTYIGQHRFNRREYRTKAPKAETEHAIMAVPPIVAEEDFHAVQRLLRSRSPKVTPPRTVSSPILLTGVCFCTSCGGAMTSRTGRGSSGGVYRYYTCSTKARQGPKGCKGLSVRMDRLDDAALDFLLSDLLAPERLEELMAPLLTHRDAWTDRRRAHALELRERASMAEAKLRHLYEAIENGLVTGVDRVFKERVAELVATRDQAEIDVARVAAMIDRTGPVLAVQDLHDMAAAARLKLCSTNPAVRRAHAHGLLQKVEVVSKHEARVLGSSKALLAALAAASGAKIAMAGFGGGLGTPDDGYAFSMSL